jgi:hypothetical protein
LYSALWKYVKSAFQVDFTYSSAASRRLTLAVGLNPRDGCRVFLVASATVEVPCELASVRGSIVADATVKTFHAHRGLKPTAKVRRR